MEKTKLFFRDNKTYKLLPTLIIKEKQIMNIRKEERSLQILQAFFKREYFEQYANKLKNLNGQIS